MEIQYSMNTPKSTPNFGMSMRIKPEAEQFIAGLPTKEREYLRTLGKRIAHSRNNIDIDEAGKVSNSWTPRANEMKIVADSEKEAVEAADKLRAKRIKKEMTAGEKFDLFLYNAGALARFVKHKASFWKSKFMRDLQACEEMQKVCDFSDNVHDVVAARLEIKDAMAAKDAKNIISEFGNSFSSPKVGPAKKVAKDVE